MCSHHLKVVGAAQRPLSWVTISCGVLSHLHLLIHGCSCLGSGGQDQLGCGQGGPPDPPAPGPGLGRYEEGVLLVLHQLWWVPVGGKRTSFKALTPSITSWVGDLHLDHFRSGGGKYGP